MIQVTISELKNRLSHYLKAVQRGEVVLIANRDRVIARIDPAGGSLASGAGDEVRLDALERQGTIRRPRGKLAPGWLERRPRAKADVVAALLDERNEGR